MSVVPNTYRIEEMTAAGNRIRTGFSVAATPNMEKSCGPSIFCKIDSRWSKTLFREQEQAAIIRSLLKATFSSFPLTVGYGDRMELQKAHLLFLKIRPKSLARRSLVVTCSSPARRAWEVNQCFRTVLPLERISLRISTGARTTQTPATSRSFRTLSIFPPPIHCMEMSFGDIASDPPFSQRAHDKKVVGLSR